jgi:hypothetical protein
MGERHWEADDGSLIQLQARRLISRFWASYHNGRCTNRLYLRDQAVLMHDIFIFFQKNFLSIRSLIFFFLRIDES